MLVWKGNDEAVCPACKHNNACLATFKQRKTLYECRDCKRVFEPAGTPLRISGDEIRQACFEVTAPSR